jgi:hydrogenase maturation protease
MTRVLVAGIGNVFLGDDGFGVEVVRQLASQPLPEGVELFDAGVGGLHLAYRLLDGYDLLIAVDAVARGGPPGTIYVVEPELSHEPETADAHAVSLPSVLALVRALGGTLCRVLVVGCEPATLGEGMGLSGAAQAAIEPVVRRIRQIAEGATHHATQEP